MIDRIYGPLTINRECFENTFWASGEIVSIARNSISRERENTFYLLILLFQLYIWYGRSRKIDRTRHKITIITFSHQILMIRMEYSRYILWTNFFYRFAIKINLSLLLVSKIFNIQIFSHTSIWDGSYYRLSC